MILNSQINPTFNIYDYKIDSECYTGDGHDYRGEVSVTESGRTCQKWTSQTPHSHMFTPDDISDEGLGDHNFCRNPEDGEPTAWCYTTDPEKTWELCDIGTARSGCNRK